MKPIRIIAALAALGLMAGASHAADPGNFDYRVKKGDSVSKITARYLWPVLYEMNKDVIGSNPHLIFPKQVFQVPDIDQGFSYGQPTANAESADVLFATPGEVQFIDSTGDVLPVVTGDQLQGIGALHTASGRALIRLGDGTVVRVFDRTIMALNGVLHDMRADSTFRFLEIKQGQVRFDMTDDPRPNDRFEVQTPVAVVEAKGKVFQVESVVGVATRISAFQGPLRVIGKSRFIDVAEGEGAFLPGEGMKIAKIALPRAPRLIRPQGVVGEHVDFEWEPIAGASRYVLTVAGDRDMTTVKFTATVYDSNTFELDLLNAGDYYYTVDSMNDLGFTSVPRSPQRFTMSKGFVGR